MINLAVVALSQAIEKNLVDKVVEKTAEKVEQVKNDAVVVSNKVNALKEKMTKLLSSVTVPEYEPPSLFDQNWTPSRFSTISYYGNLLSQYVPFPMSSNESYVGPILNAAVEAAPRLNWLRDTRKVTIYLSNDNRIVIEGCDLRFDQYDEFQMKLRALYCQAKLALAVTNHLQEKVKYPRIKACVDVVSCGIFKGQTYDIDVYDAFICFTICLPGGTKRDKRPCLAIQISDLWSSHDVY